LIGVDVTGKSDPYVYMAIGPNVDDPGDIYPHQVAKSATKKKTLNPVYNERMNLKVANLDTDVLHIEVWDHDILLKDEFLGSAVVELGKLNLHGVKHSIPHVVELQNVKSGVLYLTLLFHSLQ
jgi:Ca2+-dependent lipid-binding protein